MNEQLSYYINIINSHLERKKGDENLEEIRELFASADFIEVIRTQRMDNYFEQERKKKKDNKKVVEYLLGELGVLLRNEEADNENIEFFYFYLKSRRTKAESKKLIVLMTGLVLAVVIGYAVSQWHRVDALLFLAAPSKEDVCKEVKARYNIEVLEEAIRIESGLNDDYKTNKIYPKKVVYTIPIAADEEEVVFSGAWVPFQEVVLDYEMVLVKEYLEKHSLHVTECEMSILTFNCKLDARIEDAESKELFLQRLKSALKDSFDNDYVMRRFGSFGFSIMMGKNPYNGYVHATIHKDSMEKDLEELSEDLNAQLAKSSELLEYLE